MGDGVGSVGIGGEHVMAHVHAAVGYRSTYICD